MHRDNPTGWEILETLRKYLAGEDLSDRDFWIEQNYF